MVFLAAFFSASMPAQEKSLGDDRDRGQGDALENQRRSQALLLRSQFRGMDVDARFKEAAAKVDEARSLGQIMGIIATVLGELNDSHTYFIPPLFALEVDYGWAMQIVGERCFVSFVDKGGDAEAKGVKPGDEILEAGGYTIDRSNLWKFRYLYNNLRPQRSIRVVLRSPKWRTTSTRTVGKTD
jgi:predicted metalloprotease with PDZ domain